MIAVAKRQSILSFALDKKIYGFPSESAGSPGHTADDIRLTTGIPLAYPGLVVLVVIVAPTVRAKLPVAWLTTHVTRCAVASVDPIIRPVIFDPSASPV